jgi:hypothetical protein
MLFLYGFKNYIVFHIFAEHFILSDEFTVVYLTTL